MADFKLNEIKDSDLEVLLCGKQPKIKDSELISEFQNATVLITGAAGSIGSEIARKLITAKCKKLILVDISESALYNLQQEFFQSKFENFELVIADIRDHNRLSQTFETYKPSIVFHSAAYKHVPLMEKNPNEAVSVNVCGTKNVANLSILYGVKKCILISTDKAVNPTNVMGATKRLAELYFNCLNKKSNTKFIATRFGNVIGSSGSVIPLFRKQIEAGGPITITDKEMTRYFMTISMASHLVLQASSIGNGGEIFVFKMGSPTRVYDLALKMIALSNLQFPEDINIKIIGIRPGEKIMEELYSDSEIIESTSHESIMMVRSRLSDKDFIKNQIEALCEHNSNSQKSEIVAMMQNILPEYNSKNSTFEIQGSSNQIV